MALPKSFKGEKYIYLLMAYKLALQSKNNVSIGEDNGMVGGQNYYRRFSIIKYSDMTLLQEQKSSRAFADFSKYYEVVDSGNDRKPTIREYITESGENASAVWVH